MIDINWKPSKRELRQFAGMWLVFFGALGSFFLYKAGVDGAGKWLCLLAVAFGLPGLMLPSIMRPIYIVWMALAFPIGWTVSHLLLGAIFYLIITPIGLTLRLFGHDPMERKLDTERASYWIEHRTGDDPSTYFRQF
jgi:hypothetical protein